MDFRDLWCMLCKIWWKAQKPTGNGVAYRYVRTGATVSGVNDSDYLTGVWRPTPLLDINVLTDLCRLWQEPLRSWRIHAVKGGCAGASSSQLQARQARRLGIFPTLPRHPPQLALKGVSGPTRTVAALPAASHVRSNCLGACHFDCSDHYFACRDACCYGCSSF